MKSKFIDTMVYDKDDRRHIYILEMNKTGSYINVHYITLNGFINNKPVDNNRLYKTFEIVENQRLKRDIIKNIFMKRSNYGK